MLRSIIVTARRSIHASSALRRFKPNRGTGDSGYSSLFNNQRRWKDDDAFVAVGTTDELSSLLGVCSDAARRECLPPHFSETLTRVQCCLQDVGAHLATPTDSLSSKLKKTAFDAEMVAWIDAEIERYAEDLPPIRQFILCGGGQTASFTQYARTVARRAERAAVPLLRKGDIDPQALKFLNRASDLFFVMGRWASMKTSNEELVYLRPEEFVNQKWHSRKLDPK